MTMSDLIDREKFIYTLIFSEKTKSIFVKDLRSVIEVANEMPSAEPEQHRGEWIEDSHERGFSECSKCGYIAVSVLSERHYNFCPNCGADMRGE